MPSPNIDIRDTQGLLGPVRDFFVQDISSEDYENERGFYIVATSAGDLIVRTMNGGADITVTLAAGDWVGPRADFPAVLRAVRSNSHSHDLRGDSMRRMFFFFLGGGGTSTFHPPPISTADRFMWGADTFLWGPDLMVWQ